MRLIHNLYQLVIGLAAHRQAPFWLFIIAFIESSFFPIPPDILLIAMVFARPDRYIFYAFLTLAGSVCGALLGYAIGALFFDYIGQPVLLFYGYGDGLNFVQNLYDTHGWWLVLSSALTPLPYKIFTIASGALHMPLWPFILFSIIGRGLRFFMVAWLIARLGGRGRDFIEAHLGKLTILAAILLVGGFLVVKVLWQ